MTPKEKAYEIVERMVITCRECDFMWNAKQCALIAVNEILEISEHESPSTYVYYMEVKKEIEKL